MADVLDLEGGEAEFEIDEVGDGTYILKIDKI